jgi:hypothetical protein
MKLWIHAWEEFRDLLDSKSSLFDDLDFMATTVDNYKRRLRFLQVDLSHLWLHDSIGIEVKETTMARVTRVFHEVFMMCLKSPWLSNNEAKKITLKTTSESKARKEHYEDLLRQPIFLLILDEFCAYLSFLHSCCRLSRWFSRWLSLISFETASLLFLTRVVASLCVTQFFLPFLM